MQKHVNKDVMERVLNNIASSANEVALLTADLIKFPTVNPPGEAYQPCAEFIGARLAKRGFEIQYIRADGAPGDTDRFPRINIIARYEGGMPG